MNNKLPLVIICVIILLTLSFTASYALFKSSASNTGNTFTAATLFPTATGSITPTLSGSPTITSSISPTGVQVADHVVINEVSPEGTSSAEWVELFNPTNSSVDLSNWTISDGSSSDTIPTGNILQAGQYGVIVTNNTVVTGITNTALTITLASGTIGSGLNNTGDELTLKNASATLIDNVSWGTDETILTLSNPTSSQTLARHPNGVDTDSASDWQTNNTATIGSANP